MSEKLNFHIAQLQMLSLSLSTNQDPETRRRTLVRIREESYEATSEVIQYVPITHKPTPVVRRTFGVNDL